MEPTTTGIYSSVPEKVFSTYGDKEQVIHLLTKEPGKFIKAKKIAEECGYNTRGTCVELRKEIAELITERHLPIISNSTGFAWAKNKGQILFCIDQLDTRILGIKRRRDSLQQIHDRLD